MVKVVNDTFLYAKIGATAQAKKPYTGALSRSSHWCAEPSVWAVFDSVDVVTPYLESGALFVMTQ